MKEAFMFSGKGMRRVRTAVLIVLVFILGLTVGVSRSRKVSALSGSTYEDLKIFTDVLSLVQKDYVEPTKSKDLVYGAIKGMLETLDPHTGFMAPDTYKEMQAETKGRFEGLGIEIAVKDNVLTVVSPIEDTPAFKAGILAGDQIIKIEGDLTKNLTLMDSVKKMRGPKGSKVTITIMREGFTSPRDFVLVRDVIPVRSVRHELMEKQYGYIRISQFQEKTDLDLEKAVKALEEESKGRLQGLLLDLRNNPGGLLDQAVKVSDRFVDSGVIVSVDGRREEQKMKFYAHPGSPLTRYPLVVLVNSGSASAAEIVAGAIQDHHRGILLGTSTFGKGSVQTIFPLPDGSGLRLTTARYFTPSGRSIQAKGITPDIIVKASAPEEEKGAAPKHPLEKDLERHLSNSEKEMSKEKEQAKEKEQVKEKEQAKKEQPQTKEKKPADNQLERGLELLKSWEVFKTVAQGVK
jgi:carboxyl-terminal processing protease